MASFCFETFTIRSTIDAIDASISFSNSDAINGQRNTTYAWGFAYVGGTPPATGIDAEWTSDPPGQLLPVVNAITHPDGFENGASEELGSINFTTPAPTVATTYTLRLWIRQA